MAYKINPYNKFDKPYKNIKTIPKNTISDLFNLIEQMDTQEIMQYSLINSVPLNIQSPEGTGNNLIHEVLLNNDKLKNEYTRLNVIRFLVDNNVNPDEPNRENQTPLHISCQKQYTTISKYLVDDCGVDINYQDNYGFTPLRYLLIGNIQLYDNKEKHELLPLSKNEDLSDVYKKLDTHINNKYKNAITLIKKTITTHTEYIKKNYQYENNTDIIPTVLKKYIYTLCNNFEETTKIDNSIKTEITLLENKCLNKLKNYIDNINKKSLIFNDMDITCLLYTSPSPRD